MDYKVFKVIQDKHKGWAKQKLSDLFQEHISIFEVIAGESIGKNGYAAGSAYFLPKRTEPCNLKENFMLNCSSIIVCLYTYYCSSINWQFIYQTGYTFAKFPQHHQRLIILTYLQIWVHFKLQTYWSYTFWHPVVLFNWILASSVMVLGKSECCVSS